MRQLIHQKRSGRQRQWGTNLKQWMSRNDAEEALEALASGFDHLIGKPVCEDFAGERRNVHSGGFVLQYIAERLKVGIPPTHERVAQLECRNIGLRGETSQKSIRGGARGWRLVIGRGTYLAHDFVVRIHLTAET